MKVLQIIVGILLLGIFAFSGLALYTESQVYIRYSNVSTGFHSRVLTNEFYMVLLATFVLAVTSIPTIIFQTQRIFQPPEKKSVNDDLIDDDDIQLKTNPRSGSFLYNCAKFYSFALFTEIILLGKRSSSVLSKLNEPWHWMLLGGFLLSIFVAVYFLAVSKK